MFLLMLVIATFGQDMLVLPVLGQLPQVLRLRILVIQFLRTLLRNDHIRFVVVIVSILASLSNVRAARLTHAICVVHGSYSTTRVMVRGVRGAEPLGKPVNHGANGSILTIACGLQILDASQSCSLLESLLIATTLVIFTILLRFSVCEALRLMHHLFFVVQWILGEVRSLRFLRLLRLLGLACRDRPLTA